MIEGRSSDRLVAAWIASIALLAYAAALFGALVYDDTHTVRDNVAIRSLANLPSFLWDVDAFSDLEVRMYRPLVLATLAFDHAVGHGAAWMFKLTNVLIHASNAALVFLVGRQFGLQRVPIAVAALAFAVHPLASETVNMVSSRSDSLAALGLLVAMRGYLAIQDGSRAAWFALAAGTMVACGSKAIGVVMPGICVAIELARPSGGTWRARAMRIALPAAIGVGYLVVRRTLFGMATTAVPVLTNGSDLLNGSGRDMVAQACLMANVLPRFLVQSVVPVGLTLDPWVPLHDDFWSVPVLAGWVGVLALTWFGLRAPRRRPAVFVGTAFAWCTALPWIVIPLNLPALEHRFYVPMVGLALAFAVAVPAHLAVRPRIVIGAVGMTFALLSTLRSLDYRDPEILWRDVLAQHPLSVRGLCGLAIEHREDAIESAREGDEAKFLESMYAACDRLELAVAVYPDHYSARRNLAEFHLKLGAWGRPAYAVELAEGLIEVEPNNPFYRLLASRALGAAGRYDDAVERALSCLEIAEPKGLVFRTAASARARQGRIADAVALLDRSVARGLDHESVLVERASYLLRLGEVERARRDVMTILSRDPFHAGAQRVAAQLRAAAPR